MTDGRPTPGRASGLTIFTALRPLWTIWLRLLFRLATWLPLPRWTLLRLNAIHFARWAIVSAIPSSGPRRERIRLPRRHLFFESNFNGTWDGYIEAFSYVFPRGMRAIWGSSYGFPGAVPAAPLKEWVRGADLPASHYYVACPEASTREVLSALEVAARLRSFADDAAAATPEGFHAAYEALLVDLRRHV